MTKKNHEEIRRRRNGSPFISHGEIYREYEEEAAWIVKAQYSGEPIDYPVNCKYTFWMPSERRVDKTNLQSAADDILVRAGVLKDDNFKILAGHDGTRVMVDREHPRTEIVITRMPEEEVNINHRRGRKARTKAK